MTDQATGRKLAGVTVTVTSPALQGEQTEFTDSSGHYIITELPPGEYLVRFYFSSITLERPGVILQADKTLAVNVSIPTQKAEVKTYRITEKAPTVDVGNTQVQTQVTSELVRNTPVRGRSYDAVLTMAPGSATDPIGFSFNGSTGNENNFLIDGANTTNPAFGLIGTTLTLEFIGETEIITGGYNAEYGRATGGVVNVITKSGSNEFHGDLWFYATPFQLSPSLVARSGEAIGHQTREKYGFDFGFDLGGPIVKDKVWFYVGFAPTFQTDQTDVVFRARSANNAPAGMLAAPYAGDLDSSTSCPSYIDKGICGLLAPGYSLTQLDSKYNRHYTQDTRLYNWIAKFNFQFNANNSMILQYIGSPQTNSGAINPSIGAAPYFNGADSQLLADKFNNVHDVLLHYVSKLADRRLQLDVIGAYHFEDQTTTPRAGIGGNDPQIVYQGTQNLTDFRGDLVGSPCDRTSVGGQDFLPCPVSNYSNGGFGYIQHTTVQRVSASIAATYFARLAGTHALKLGFDFEDAFYRDQRSYTGGFYVLTDPADVTSLEGHGYGTASASGAPGDPGIVKDSLTFNTSTLDYGAYLRDSYNVSFIPGLTVNGGVRWEAQQVKGNDGSTAIGIYDNWAPRVGAIYDFTRKGRGKIFASYGWFYENIPLDINDRSFSPEGDAVYAGTSNMMATAPSSINCNANGIGIIDPHSCSVTTPRNMDLLGGSVAKVAPKLRGQYSEEVVAGVQYDVGLDIVLGASYIHRDLGRIIEDMSPDGGHTYFIANPGDKVDSTAVSDLQKQIAATTDPVARAKLQSQLQLYQQLNTGFPKPVRNYDALVITATKRLSHNFLLLASYTYSRTLGNYPGLYQLSDNQTDPNISTQYDFREFLLNRNGPLPNDRPHNVKLQGSYFIPFGDNRIVLGLAFNGNSGRPIEVLGAHYAYGPNEVFVLPRGSGGRTPFVTSFDLHASYGRKLARGFNFEAYADVFNLFDQQAVTQVDDSYTFSKVAPIQNGKVSDLAGLKTIAGSQVIVNPNYGHATSFQQPLSMRFGVRLSF